MASNLAINEELLSKALEISGLKIKPTSYRFAIICRISVVRRWILVLAVVYHPMRWQKTGGIRMPWNPTPVRLSLQAPSGV